MVNKRRLLAATTALAFYAGALADAQVVTPSSGQIQCQKMFVASGTWTAPGDVHLVYINGSGAGGSGAGGQTGGNTAGSSGGGAAVSLENHPCNVTPGATLTITMTVPSGQTAVAGTGADGSSTTIAGCLEGYTITLLGGHGGIAATAGAGSVGAASAFSGRLSGGIAGATAGSSVAAFGPNTTNTLAAYQHQFDGQGSGGGGNTAGTAGSGGGFSGRFSPVSAGTGNGAGSGGGSGYWGAGQVGTAVTVDCSATPTWVGFGGGGCGGGSGAKGGPGGPPFVLINGVSAIGF